MKYRMIFLSALDIWSMKDGVGAPSFYKTLSLYIQKGHDVILIKPNGKKHKDYKIEGLKEITFNYDFLDSLLSIRYISFFSRILIALYQRYKYYSIASSLIESSCLPCIVYAYEVSGVFAARKLHLKYFVPFITRFQGTVLGGVANNWLNRLRYFPHFQALEQESNLVIMTDDGTKGDAVLKQLGNQSEQIKFWKNGVSALTNSRKFNDSDLGQFRKIYRQKYNLGENTIVLMTLCRLAYWKRIDRAIVALEGVIKVHRDVKLIIVGDGSEKENLLQLCKVKQLSNFVVFVGGIKQKDTVYYYAMCDIFLSLYDLSNVGNPLLEALVYGKVILTLNTGDTASVINNGINGVVVPVNQLSEIASAINNLIENEDFRKKLSDGAKLYARYNLWTWEKRMEIEYNVVMNVADKYYTTQV